MYHLILIDTICCLESLIFTAIKFYISISIAKSKNSILDEGWNSYL